MQSNPRPKAIKETSLSRPKVYKIMDLVREIKTELPLYHALATGSKTHLPGLTLQSAPDK